MSDIRVTQFTDSDVFAGTERHILDLSRGLRAAGIDVSIACPSPSALADKAAAEDFRVICIQKNGLIDRAAIHILVDLLRSGGTDIIHSHNGRTMLSSALAVLLARNGRAITTQHFLEPDHVSKRGLAGPMYHIAHRWVNRRMSHVIAISDAVRTGILRRADVADTRLTTVHNGITSPDPTTLTAPDRVRVELAIPSDAPLIVCVARLEREKDVSSLVKAMHIVRTDIPSAVCVIVGAGSQEEALRQQIRDLRPSDSTKLLGFRSDALSIILAGDVFVLPSLAEPFGLVLLEAMALSRPVIATCAGGPLEIVADGETGLLVPPSDCPALACAIRSLLQDRARARALGQAGAARFRDLFTVDRMAKATRAIYERVLS